MYSDFFPQSTTPEDLVGRNRDSVPIQRFIILENCVCVRQKKDLQENPYICLESLPEDETRRLFSLSLLYFYRYFRD